MPLLDQSSGTRSFCLGCGLGIVLMAMAGMGLFALFYVGGFFDRQFEQPLNAVLMPMQPGAPTARLSPPLPGEVVRVLGRPIFRDHPSSAGDLDPDLRRDIRIDLLHMRITDPLYTEYARQQGLYPTDSAVDRYLAYRAAQSAKLGSSDREERPDTDLERRSAINWIVKHEVERHLYRLFGGRLASTSLGEPVDAVKRFLLEREQAGDLVFFDTALRTEYFTRFDVPPRDTLMTLRMIEHLEQNLLHFPWEIAGETATIRIASAVGDDQPPRAASPKGVSRHRIRVEGRRLLVDGKPFQVRGVGYSPFPIGTRPGSFSPWIAKQWQRDLPVLRALHCNAVRTWGEIDTTAFLDACWNNGQEPVYVIMGFWIDPDVDLRKESNRAAIRKRFTAYVKAYAGHPAVLFWSLGSHNNLNYRKGPIKDFYTLCNELAEIAWKIEGEAYHPVAIVNGDINAPVGSIGREKEFTTDAQLAFIDIWGTSYYSTQPMDAYIAEYRTRSAMPLWIAEIGMDAIDARTKQENQNLQAEWDLEKWRDIAAAANVCIGASLMEYCDEWWKFERGTVTRHDLGGHYNYMCYPDTTANEEWFGIVSLDPVSGQADRVTPRAVYYALQKAWAQP